jgi:hypothetical protein
MRTTCFAQLLLTFHSPACTTRVSLSSRWTSTGCFFHCLHFCHLITHRSQRCAPQLRIRGRCDSMVRCSARGKHGHGSRQFSVAAWHPCVVIIMAPLFVDWYRRRRRGRHRLLHHCASLNIAWVEISSSMLLLFQPLDCLWLLSAGVIVSLSTPGHRNVGILAAANTIGVE